MQFCTVLTYEIEETRIQGKKFFHILKKHTEWQSIDPWASFSCNIVIIKLPAQLWKLVQNSQHDRSCQNCPTFKMAAPITTRYLSK